MNLAHKASLGRASRGVSVVWPRKRPLRRPHRALALAPAIRRACSTPFLQYWHLT